MKKGLSLFFILLLSSISNLWAQSGFTEVQNCGHTYVVERKDRPAWRFLTQPVDDRNWKLYQAADPVHDHFVIALVRHRWSSNGTDHLGDCHFVRINVDGTFGVLHVVAEGENEWSDQPAIKIKPTSGGDSPVGLDPIVTSTLKRLTKHSSFTQVGSMTSEEVIQGM